MRCRESRVAGLALMLLGVALFPLAARGQSSKPYLEVQSELTEDDPKDDRFKESYRKAHRFKMEAGKAYRIDVMSRDLDTIVRLESPDRKIVGMDDDGGEGSNSRLVYKGEGTGG